MLWYLGLRRNGRPTRNEHEPQRHGKHNGEVEFQVYPPVQAPLRRILGLMPLRDLSFVPSCKCLPGILNRLGTWYAFVLCFGRHRGWILNMDFWIENKRKLDFGCFPTTALQARLDDM